MLVNKRNMKFIDIHTHTYPSNLQEDILSVYNISINNGEIDKYDQNLIYSVGIHPWFITDKESSMEHLNQLKEVIQQYQIKMIGEAGLDKITSAPLDWQQYLFEQQILLAEETHKPLIIHCVKTSNEVIALHKKYRPSSPWIIHGFRGKGELAKQFIKEGIFLSFGEHFQSSALQAAWPNYLFIETDESKFNIQLIYKNIAKELGIDLEILCKQIEINFNLKIC